MNEQQICTWITQPLYFKLDAFTVRNDWIHISSDLSTCQVMIQHSFVLFAFQYLGIYSKTSRIKTTTFACGGVKDPDCTTMVYNGEPRIKCTNEVGCPKCYPTCLALSLEEKWIVDTSVKRKLTITGIQYAGATAVCEEKVYLIREHENVS